MKIALHLVLPVVMASVLAGCSTVTVSTDYDRSANFGKYHTYFYAPPRAGGSMSPSSEAALHDALHAELAARGLTEVSAKKADLDVVRHVFVQEKVSVQQWTDWGYGYGYGRGWPYGFGYYHMWPGAPTTYTDVNQYHEGTLVLDFVDTRTKSSVFRGVGTAVVGGQESNAEKIREAVTKILAQFPGGAAQPASH